MRYNRIYLSQLPVRMEDQQLSESTEIAQKRATNALSPYKGAKTQATARKALSVAVRSINNKRNALGLGTINEKEFTAIGAMAACALEYEMSVELDHKSFHDKGEEMPPNVIAGHALVLMKLWKEVAPYVERKQAPEPVTKDSDDDSSISPMAQMLSIVREKGERDRLKYLEENKVTEE